MRLANRFLTLIAVLPAVLAAATWTIPVYRPNTARVALFNPQGEEITVAVRLGSAFSESLRLAPGQSLDLGARIPPSLPAAALSLEAAAGIVVDAREDGAALPVFTLGEVLLEGSNHHALALPPSLAAGMSVNILPLTPLAGVEILAFDRNQRELAKRSFDNLRAAATYDLREGVADPAALDRVELRILRGSLWAQVVYTLPNGRRQTLRWTAEEDLSARAWLPDLRSGDTLRLLSFGNTAGRLTAVPFGSGWENPTPALSDLPLGTATDVADPLERWYRAPAGSRATLNLTSTQPFLALHVRPGESIRAAANPLPAPGRLLWLLQPSAEALSLEAGRGGANGFVRVLDETGREWSNTPLTVDPYGTARLLAADLLSGELPARVSFLVVLNRGELAGALASSEQPLLCPVPELEASASEAALSAAGEVELTWSTSSATEVFWQEVTGTGAAGAPQILEPSGSRRLSVSATRSIYFEARNSCGAVSRQVTVLLGLPRIRSLSGPTRAPSGGLPAIQPGDLVTVKLLDDVPLESIEAVSVSVPGGRSVWVEAAEGPDGSLAFTAPLIPAANPELHYSGPVEVRLVSDGEEGPAQRMQMNRLVYAGNATADLQRWFEEYVSWAAARRAELAQVTGGAAFVNAMAPLLDANVRELRTELAQLAASGTATMAMNQPSRAYPAPLRFTATTADAVILMALKQKLEARADLRPDPNSPPGTAPRAKPGEPLAAATGEAFDLQRDPLYATCLAVLNHDVNAVVNRSIFDQLYDLMATTVDTTIDVAAAVGQLRAVALFNKFRKLGGRLETFCQLYPMGLNGFTVTPAPDPIPYVDFLEQNDDTPPVVNRGTRINARFQALMSKEEAANRAADGLGQLVKLGAKGLTKKASEKVKNEAEKRAEEFAKRTHDAEADAIRAWLESNDAPLGSVERLVYKADIDAVPERTPRLPSDFLRRNEVNEARADQANSPTWGFYGNPRYEHYGDRHARVRIVPLARRFIFLDPVTNATDLKHSNRRYASRSFVEDVTVGRARTGLRVVRATIGPDRIRGAALSDLRPNRWMRSTGNSRFGLSIGPRQQFFEHNDCRGVEADIGCTRGGSGSYLVRALSRDRYEVSAEATSSGSNYPGGGVKSRLPQSSFVQVQFFNPPRFNNQQKVFLSWKSSVSNRENAGIQNGRVTALLNCTLVNAQGNTRSVQQQFFPGAPGGSLIEQGITSGTCSLSLGGDGNGRAKVDLTIRLTSY